MWISLQIPLYQTMGHCFVVSQKEYAYVTWAAILSEPGRSVTSTTIFLSLHTLCSDRTAYNSLPNAETERLVQLPAIGIVRCRRPTSPSRGCGIPQRPAGARICRESLLTDDEQQKRRPLFSSLREAGGYGGRAPIYKPGAEHPTLMERSSHTIHLRSRILIKSICTRVPIQLLHLDCKFK